MKRFIGIAVLLVALAAAVWWQAFKPEQNEPRRDGVEVTTAPNVTAPENTEVTGATEPPEAVKAFLAFNEFQQQTRAFFEQASELNADQQRQQLQDIEQGTEQFEQQGKLLPMEALILKLAMLKYTSRDEQDYKTRAKALIDQYQAISDAREQAWLANPDPKFVEYKRREMDIVNEVRDMTIIPDGLSRDEYLRQRLLAARIAAMGTGSDNGG